MTTRLASVRDAAAGPPSPSLEGEAVHRNEALWVYDKLLGVDRDSLSPMLNIGSSTREYRESIQPWTHEVLIGPLQRRGVDVIHSDMREVEGIDVRADVLDDADMERLTALGAKSVPCCNMLEHVRDPMDLARRCPALVPDGGYMVVTVPHSDPHHRNPIDTMFRPKPDEIIALFGNVEVIEKEIITVG